MAQMSQSKEIAAYVYDAQSDIIRRQNDLIARLVYRLNQLDALEDADRTEIHKCASLQKGGAEWGDSGTQ